MRPEFREKNLPKWDELLWTLFKGNIPTGCRWETKEDMINVLNHIGKYPNVNHTFLPSGGGLDLKGAADSYEPGCLELRLGEQGAYVIQPRALTFQSFDAPHEWSYFRLDTDPIQPSGVYEGLHRQSEELTEISPLEYVERIYWDEGYCGYDENGYLAPLPESARLVIRFFSGSFVIFAKASTYNAINETYDGRHSKMSAEDFRQYIARTVEKMNSGQ